MKLRASDYEVRDTNPCDAKRFVKEYHYSRGCSRTCVYAHGLFKRGENQILGAALWLPPTRPAAESVNRRDWRRVLALSRLACHPDIPSNAASFLMGRSIRAVKNDGRFCSLVTYADEFMAHRGTIYFATNWTFVGVSPPIARWEDANGRQVAKRSTRNRSSAEMAALGYKMVGKYRKRKFVLHFDPARSYLTKMYLSPLVAAVMI